MSITIAVVSVVVFAAVIVGAILLTPIFKNLWWIPGAIALVTLIGFGVAFHSWWFFLLAFLLAALTATAMYFDKMRLISAILIVLITIGAMFVIVPGMSKEFDKVKLPDSAQMVPDISKTVDSVTKKVDEVKSDIPVIDSNCEEAKILESQTHGNMVEDDLNDGDPFDYSLTIVNPDVPQGDKTLVVLTEPTKNFDVTYKVMYFTSYRLRGTLDQAACSAAKLASKAQTYVFVGNTAAPKGWNTVDKVSGWWGELVAKQNEKSTIDTGGKEWTPHQIATDTKDRLIKFNTAVHGQVWNPATKGVFHFQVAKGYQIVIPAGLQGTYWEIPEGAINVQERILESSVTVIIQDKINPGNLTRPFCGDANSMPTTVYKKEGYTGIKWTAIGESWKCSKQ